MYGNHRWTVSYVREDKMLGVNLNWKNASEVSWDSYNVQC